MMSKQSHDNICAVIPARYESSRLRGKPLLKIGNQTIIERTYKQTKKSKLIKEVFVVSDDDRIVSHIEGLGGICFKVDIDCLNGTERICHALPHIAETYDIIVNVQGDEPFINPDNIDFSIQKYLENESDENMVCTTIHNKLNKAHDILNKGIGKMIIDKNDNVMYCSRSVIPHTKTGEICNDTNYYGHIGIFVFRRSFLSSFLSSPNTPAQLSEDIEWLKIMEMGYRIKSYQVDDTEIGINTIDDYNYLSNKYTRS